MAGALAAASPIRGLSRTPGQPLARQRPSADPVPARCVRAFAHGGRRLGEILAVGNLPRLRGSGLAYQARLSDMMTQASLDFSKSCWMFDSPAEIPARNDSTLSATSSHPSLFR